MENNKYLVLLLTLFPFIAHSAPNIVQPAAPQPPISSQPRASSQKPSLSTVKFSTACGLPFFIQNGNYYFILSREAGGADKGTFDDFGGKRDPGENHPQISAAREFWEEAILTCVGLNTAQDTQRFIDPSGNALFCAMSFGQSVTYIVDFTAYKDAFFNNFYAAREKARGHFREKDRLAIVPWDILKVTIGPLSSTNLNGIKLNTGVLDPKTLLWNIEEITLRPYFVKKMRLFFQDKDYVQGEHPKVRFYGLPRR